MKQTAEITLETKETIVVHRPNLIERRNCPLCCKTVDMVAPYVIASVSNTTEREIFRLVESGLLYSFASDRLRVCITCLENERRKLCEI